MRKGRKGEEGRKESGRKGKGRGRENRVKYERAGGGEADEREYRKTKSEGKE